MLYLIIQVLIVAASSWLLTKEFFRIERYSDSILVSFLLSFAQVVLVATFLGIIGKLYFVNVFIAHILILVVVSLLYLRKTTSLPTKPDLKPFIDSKLLLFAVSIFSSFALVSLYKNLINPPLDADSLIYHLAFPASWIKSASLNTPFFIFSSSPVMIPGSLELSPPSYFPINADLFFLWLMFPLRNAFLADLGQVPFYFIGILAVFSVLRKYGLAQKTALLAGFLLFLIPNIFKQLKTAAQIDVICLVLFLLVIFALLLLKFNFTFKNAVLFGISLGLFIGTKFNNVIWLLALLPFISYIFYIQTRASRLPPLKLCGFVGVIVSTVVLFGGYMYIKNYFLTGDPIFPVDLKIFGKTIFKGLVDSSSYKMLFSDDSFRLSRIFREGLGAQSFLLIFPCTFLPLLFGGYLKKRMVSFWEYLFLFLAPLIALILFKGFIGAYVTRYLFPYLGLGLLTAVIFVTRFAHGEKYFYAVSFISILYAAFQMVHRYELVISLLLSAACFALLLGYRKQLVGFYENKNFIKSILVVFIVVCAVLIYSNNKYNSEEYDRYVSSLSKNEKWQVDLRKGWKALNETTGEGARVAYTGRQEAYPLYGNALKNDVKYVSVNEKEITPYNNPDGRYRQAKDFSAWIVNLKRDKIEYLFVAKPVFENRESPDADKFPIEDEWASAHPDLFEPVFKNSLAHIYKLSPG